MSDDCRDCAFNSYAGFDRDWVSCNHPVTLAKTPKWQEGDPAFVNYRTADVPVSQIHELQDCPTWAPRIPQECARPADG